MIIELSKQKIISHTIPIGFLVIWSGGAVFAKVGLNYTTPWSFLLLRSAIALTLLLAIFLAKPKTHPSNYQLFLRLLTDSANLWQIIYAGLLMQVFYLTFYFLAIQTGLSLGIIILILGLQPLLTAILTSPTLNYRDLFLLLICFLGLVIATIGYHAINEVNTLGLLFSVLALLAITFGTIAQAKVHLPTFSSNSNTNIVILLIQTTIAVIMFSLIVLFKGFYFEVNPYSMASLIWMGAIVSVGAYLLLMVMLKISSANKVSTLFFLLPLLTMILESLVFDTSISSLSMLGVFIVCMGLLLYQIVQRKQPFERQQ
ncbi:DMT family transporter [Psychrobacter sp. I-STPA10]|uniref:DMT family transporter n=1 Tax=Psychrobacter sp. I-STPA10 TaxID=2585769 RepID=UPI001E4318E5|nr:DMT family transporter [Psychrobacter sp. I-STPA10]